MDKLYFNGKVYSIDDENRAYTAIGIKDGKIAFLGNDEEAKAIDAKEKIDLKGNTVLPGLVDSHLHVLNYAFVNASYKMFDADSIEGIIEEGKKRVAAMKDDPDDKWFFGRGWNENNFKDEQRVLTRQDLDKISTDRPILMIRVCGHIASVNSKAMEIVLGLPGIEPYRHLMDPEKGILTESSTKLCYNAMTKPTLEDIKKYVLASQKDMNARGLTGIHTDNFLSLPGRDWRTIVQAFKELSRDKELTLRVTEQPSFTCFDDMKEFIDEGYRTGQGDDFYRIGPIKLYEDGSLGAKTALLHEPFEGTDTCGQVVHEQEDIDNCVDYAYKNDNQILVHVIGDKAADMVMDAYEKAIKKYGDKGLRLALNHCQFTSETLFDRMVKYNIMGFIQPVFVASDKGIVRKLVGEKREALSYRWKTMLDMGIKCCGGSDCPVESFDILSNIQNAVTRDRLDEVTEGWHPEQKLSVLESIKLFTSGAAYGSFDEKIKGTLELGKYADFVILGQDIFEVDAHKIKDIPVVATVLEGKEVFRAE